MAINIFTQYDVNGSVNSRGKVYIGVYGQNPIDNPIDVYTDVNLTDSVSGFGIDLDFNGLPIVGGQRVNLYINESYSIQMKDEDNAYLFVDWVNVQNPVNEVEAQNWLKDLASLTPNLVLANDGNGNWTINAAALGGGDVFQAGNNTFTGDNSFQGAIGTAQYLIDTSSTPFSSGVTASFPVVVGDSGYFEYEFLAKVTGLSGSGELFLESSLSSDTAIAVTHAAEILFNQGTTTEQNSRVSSEPNVVQAPVQLFPTSTTEDFTLSTKGIAYFSESEPGNGISLVISNRSGTIAGTVSGVSIKTRKLTPANVTLI